MAAEDNAFPPRTVARIDRWSWVLVYVGIVLVALGLAVARAEPPLGSGMAVAGGLAIVVGIALIWLRSRMKT